MTVGKASARKFIKNSNFVFFNYITLEHGKSWLGIQGKIRGTIALDIDGTITDGKTLDPKIQNKLEQLMREGWDLLFLTGRTFSFSASVFKEIAGPFKVIVQNGAATVEMPSRKVVATSTLPKSDLQLFDPLFKDLGYGLLVESGIDQEDVCYYKSQDFLGKERDYLEFRNQLCPERWESLSSFDDIPVPHFAVGKYFALSDEAQKLKVKMEEKKRVKITIIRDPFRPGYDLALINNPETSKGLAMKRLEYKPPLIAAGDDVNDISLLEIADVKIVMSQATEEMLKMADIISEPPKKLGIIAALEEAISRC